MVYTTEEIRAIVSPVAEKYGLKAVWVFGSYARGTACADSDIDLLIDTDGTELNTLFKLGALYDDLSSALGKNVDLITVSSLEQPPVRQSEVAFRQNIMKERKDLYAAA